MVANSCSFLIDSSCGGLRYTGAFSVRSHSSSVLSSFHQLLQGTQHLLRGWASFHQLLQSADPVPLAFLATRLRLNDDRRNFPVYDDGFGRSPGVICLRRRACLDGTTSLVL